jgi:hypothetical protein
MAVLWWMRTLHLLSSLGAALAAAGPAAGRGSNPRPHLAAFLSGGIAPPMLVRGANPLIKMHGRAPSCLQVRMMSEGNNGRGGGGGRGGQGRGKGWWNQGDDEEGEDGGRGHKGRWDVGGPGSSVPALLLQRRDLLAALFSALIALFGFAPVHIYGQPHRDNIETHTHTRTYKHTRARAHLEVKTGALARALEHPRAHVDPHARASTS